MKNKTVKGIIALAVVTALSFAVIIGSNQLSKNMTAGTQGETAEITEELDVSGTEQIDKAAKTESGYVVTVREKGYGGDIVMNVSFDETAASVTKLEITEQNETEGLGSKITDCLLYTSMNEKTMVSDALVGVNGELKMFGDMIPQTENQELKPVSYTHLDVYKRQH